MTTGELNQKQHCTEISMINTIYAWLSEVNKNSELKYWYCIIILIYYSKFLIWLCSNTIIKIKLIFNSFQYG